MDELLKAVRNYLDISAPGQRETESEIGTYAGPSTQSFNRQLARTRSQILKTANEIRMEIVDEVEDAEASFDLKLDGLSTSFSNKLTQQSASFDVKLNGLSSSFTDQLNGLSATFDVKLSGLSSTFEDELNGLSASFKVQFDGLSASFEDKLSQQSAAFDVKLDGLSATFEDGLSGLRSEFTTGLNGLSSRLTSAEGAMSELSQTLEGFATRVEDAEGAVSEIRQTAESLSSMVEDAEGRLSTMEQTATSITSRVEELDGSYSELSQDVEGFQATVADLKTGMAQTVRLGADGITITNARGSKLTIDGGQIKAETLDLTGCITFSDLDKDTQDKVSETGISEKEATTLINSTLVSSPRIEGADICGGTFHDAEGLGNFELTWEVSGSSNKIPGITFQTAGKKPIFQVMYLEASSANIYGATMSLAGVPLLGSTQSGSTLMTTAYGNWVFTGIVAGVNLAGLTLSPDEQEQSTETDAQGDPGMEEPSTGEPKETPKVKLLDKGGKFCIETDGVTWYLDANGLHQ